jgi:hypothetical protein
VRVADVGGKEFKNATAGAVAGGSDQDWERRVGRWGRFGRAGSWEMNPQVLLQELLRHTITPQGKAATAFLFELIAQLQNSATVR